MRGGKTVGRGRCAILPMIASLAALFVAFAAGAAFG